MSNKHLYVRKASAGSGKTFTLAAHYIALLLHGESYRSILAVTFTNKATAEMKARIIGYLYDIGQLDQTPEGLPNAASGYNKATRGFLHRVREIYDELGFRSPDISSDEYCAQKARELFRAILSDYDAMHVSTIDAFLQSLLGGMVQMLGGMVGYSVELDTDGVISDAVDRLLTIGAQNEATRQHITTYMDERMADEKNWDVRDGLKRIAGELYKELLQEKEAQLVMQPDRLAAYKDAVDWHKHPAVEALRTVLQQVDATDKTILKVKTRMEGSMDGTMTKTDYIFKGFTEKELAKIPVGSPAMQMHELGAQCRRAWFRYRLTTAHLNDLVLMNELKQLIQAALNESNTRLLGVTANTLAKALQKGDADFVLEKAGIRYRHIMLDEFQDTSSLQWINFSKLLTEILSTEAGSTLIVGDIKQSIYRWRNGDWTIMAGLDSDWAPYYNREVPALKRNFRSKKEVVQFNLETMRRLTDYEVPAIRNLYEEGYLGLNIDEYYRSGNEGGYVRLQFFPAGKSADERRAAKEEMVREMFRAIGQLIEQGVPMRDMMILIRKNKEAATILRVMEEMRLHYPIVSNDCFELQFSQSVRTVVQAMRLIYLNDGVAREYLCTVHPNADIRRIEDRTNRMLSLSDLVEKIERVCLCDEQGVFTGTDIAYLNSLKDKVRSFVATNGSDGKRFLTLWEEKLKQKTIPSVEGGGIRMMTIHASKGLEAKNLFIPFCDWKMEEDKNNSQLWCEVEELQTENGKPAILPILQGKNTADAGFDEEYMREHALQRIDNLNLLYVALTRAAERLYIYADVADYQKKEHTAMDVAQLLHSLYGEEGEGPTKREWGSLPNEQSPAKREQSSLPNGQRPTKDEKPLEFSSAAEMAMEGFSSEEHIEFQQSQDSRKYGWDVANETAKQDTIARNVFGTICHEILATLGTYPTQQAAAQAAADAVEEAYSRGIIPSEDVKNEIMPLVTATVTNKQMCEWFTGDWRVQREEAIVYLNEDGQPEEKRMDRVMWRDKEAVVLDYKFGHDNPKYDLQVRQYMQICQRMGAEKVSGYLWIAAEERLESV